MSDETIPLLSLGLLTCTATNAVRRKCRREEHPPRNDMVLLNLIQRTRQPGFSLINVGKDLHGGGCFC